MDDSALDLAAQVGTFFVLDRWTADAGWRPLRELAERPDVLVERVAAARRLLAGRSRVPVDQIEERAAASIVFLGLAARLVSPAFACAALADQVPDLSIERLWWKPVEGGPWPMARSAGEPLDPAAPVAENLADELDARILAAVVAPVLGSFATTFSLSSQVLWGNVASSLAGAQTMLAAAHPDRAAAGRSLLGRLLERGTLRATGDLDVAGTPFRRRSCCLFYRMPGAGICGDCVLTDVP